MIVSFCISCMDKEYNIKQEIKEVGKNQSHSLNFQIEENQHPDMIKIAVIGSINDTAKIGQQFLIPPKVDTVFKHEWYSNDYILEYYPYKATSGYLQIDVELVAY